MLIRLCPTHAAYSGRDKPLKPCENCWGIWAMNHPEALGVTLAEMHAKTLNPEVQNMEVPTLPPGRVKRGRIVR